ncbi:MAG: Arm DNA-binding domain-containing protein [Synechococcaceae cyanobacterium]
MRPDPSRPGSKHHDRDGLYLWVARSGSKTWRKDYRWEGAREAFTIGTYPKVRLADARKVAMQINDWLRDGIDPRRQSSRQRRERERPEAKPFREVQQSDRSAPDDAHPGTPQRTQGGAFVTSCPSPLASQRVV